MMAPGPPEQTTASAVGEQRGELVGREERRALGVARRHRGAVLHDEADVRRRRPAVDPADEPVERVVVGADRDEHERRW